MTPAIPPDARKVVLAAVVPCKGDDLAPFVPKCSVPAGSEWEAYAASAQCATCIGNYERWVVTDIEVEQRESPWMVVGYDNPEGPSIVGRRDGWYPVEAEQ